MPPEELAFEETVSRRFQANSAQTYFAKTVSKDPIALTRMDLKVPSRTWTEAPEPEAAFSIHVVLSPFPAMKTRIQGHEARLDPMKPGGICLFDLSVSPTVMISDPAVWLRIQISQRTLHDLAYDRGQASIGSLCPTFGEEDPVLYALGLAMKRQLRVYGGGDPLFWDHVALAIYSHVAQTYGQLRNDQLLRGGLAPWQFRRACDLMMSRLSEGVSVGELAEVCQLSASHFSRAFRQSAGMPAHRWLMRQRVGHAKNLLLGTSLSVAEIAAACGFNDQSHLSRVFFALEGRSPARWRHARLQ